MRRRPPPLTILITTPLLLWSLAAESTASPAPDGPQPGVEARRPPPVKQPKRPPPAARQVVESENPITDPHTTPAPSRPSISPRYTARPQQDDSGANATRRMLLAQSKARINQYRVGRNLGVGFTLVGGILVTIGGCGVLMSEAGFIVMLVLVPIGGLAVLSGIPVWAIMNSLINAEESAIKRLRRFRIQQDNTPKIARVHGTRHLRSTNLSSPLRLRF